MHIGPELDTKLKDTGLLVMRLGMGGIYLLVHGGPKLLGGPDTWSQVGQAMGTFGITFGATFWGFMAAFSEGAGGAALLVGLFTRPMSVLIAITMFVAGSTHLVTQGQGLSMASHPFKMVVVLIALILMGPGRYSVSEKVPSLRNTWLS